MDTLALFGFSVAFSVTAWGVVTARYFWPMLRILPQRDALRLLLTLHAFRFVGLAFLVPGVVGPGHLLMPPYRPIPPIPSSNSWACTLR